MVRRPDTSDRVVDTLDRLGNPLELLSARVPQQLNLLEDLQRLQVAHADGLLLAVDVVADYDGVLIGSRRHGDFDLGVCGGELGEDGLEEAAVFGEGVV